MAHGLEFRSSIDNSVLMNTDLPVMLFIGKSTPTPSMAMPYYWEVGGIYLDAPINNSTSRTVYHNATYPTIESGIIDPNTNTYTTKSYYAAFGQTEIFSGSCNGSYFSNPVYISLCTCPFVNTPNNIPPMCFVNVPEDCFFYCSVPTFSATTQRWSCYVYVYSSLPISAYWFYNPKGLPASSDTYGLRIWDESAPQKLVFDSGWGHFGSISSMIQMPFNNNSQSLGSSVINTPGIMYYNSYISRELIGPWSYSYSEPGYSGWITGKGDVEYSRFLKYNLLNNSLVLSIKDISIGYENTNSIPIAYIPMYLGPLNSVAGDSGGSSPSGDTLYVPIIDCALYD